MVLVCINCLKTMTYESIQGKRTSVSIGLFFNTTTARTYYYHYDMGYFVCPVAAQTKNDSVIKLEITSK